MKKLLLGLYALVTVGLMIWGFYQAIYVAPSDAMQGEISRIFYYHVPNAMLSFLFFAISLCGSIGYLAFRRSNPDHAQIADAWALSGAEVGVIFCTVVLTTGPALGPPRVGHLVDMGCAPHHHPRSLAHLRQLSAAAPLRRRPADADTRGRTRNLRRPRRPHRLHVQPLVAHPAPRTRLRRRCRLRHQRPHHGRRLWLECSRLVLPGESSCSCCATTSSANISRTPPSKPKKL